jgi:hypothetical protein
MKPQVIDVATAAFPANVIGTLLPAEKDIPRNFRDHWCDRRGWTGLVHQWFFKGLTAETLIAKPGIDRHAAIKHLSACMRSYEPRHEHKVAGVAYLMSEWFDPITIERAKGDA